MYRVSLENRVYGLVEEPEIGRNLGERIGGQVELHSDATVARPADGSLEVAEILAFDANAASFSCMERAVELKRNSGRRQIDNTHVGRLGHVTDLAEKPAFAPLGGTRRHVQVVGHRFTDVCIVTSAYSRIKVAYPFRPKATNRKAGDNVHRPTFGRSITSRSAKLELILTTCGNAESQSRWMRS